MKFFQSLKSVFFADRFESAKNSPVRAPIVYREPADAHAELPHMTRFKLVSVMRNLYANNGFVRDIVAANDVYSVGDGITPQGSTADEAWNTAAEELFENWSKCVDVRGMLTLSDALSLASQRLDIDGEFFVLKRVDSHGIPRLEFLETQRCDADFNDPAQNIVQGIRFGKDGAPKGYFFKDGNSRAEFSAKHVVHCFVPETFSSVHGLPLLQHAANSIRDTKEILALVIARAEREELLLEKERGALVALTEIEKEWSAAFEKIKQIFYEETVEKESNPDTFYALRERHETALRRIAAAFADSAAVSA